MLFEADNVVTLCYCAKQRFATKHERDDKAKHTLRGGQDCPPRIKRAKRGGQDCLPRESGYTTGVRLTTWSPFGMTMPPGRASHRYART